MAGELLGLLAAFCYALGYVYIRRSLKKIGSDTATLVTLFINGLFFVVLLPLASFFSPLPRLTAWSLLWFALAGLMGPFLGRATLYASMARLGAARSASLKATAPLFTTFLAIPFLGENLSPPVLAGLLVTVLGVYLVSSRGAGREGEKREGARTADLWRQGLVYGFWSAFFFGAVNIARKEGLLLTPSALLASSMAGLIALAAFAAYFAIKGTLRQVLLIEDRLIRRNMIIAGTLNGTAILFYFLALKLGRVSVVAALANTEPVFLLPLSVFLLRTGEHLDSRLVLGVILTIVGVATVLLLR